MTEPEVIESFPVSESVIDFLAMVEYFDDRMFRGHFLRHDPERGLHFVERSTPPPTFDQIRERVRERVLGEPVRQDR